MKALALLFAIPFLALPALAQTPAKLKAELRTKEAAAKRDPNALFDAAKWALEKGLATEARRIFQAILKIDPEHEGANRELGNEKFDGKWMPAKEAEEARKKAMEAQFKDKGLVEVDGVYVEPGQVEDAKKGIFHDGSDLVTKQEKLALLEGRVRHPVTGMLIAAADLEKAQQGLFPVGSGRWVDAKEADNFHRDPQTPWIYRTAYMTLISTLPVAELDKVKLSVDQAYETIGKFFDGKAPTPAHRPVVFVAATRDEYASMGSQFGDASSAYGAFLGTRDERGRIEVKIPFQDKVRPAFCNWAEKGWGEYYARHAGGLAYLSALLFDMDASVPDWFEQAFGSYASRFANGFVAGFFGEQHVQKGGVKDLKSWFASFDVNGDMEGKQIDANIYQAGLMLSFAASGANGAVTAEMREISRCFAESRGKDLEPHVKKLESLLIQAEPAIREHLQKLVANKDR